MKEKIWNIRENRYWALLPLGVLIWHSITVAYTLHPDYLFFVCYPANLILIFGIAFRLRLLVGIGFGRFWVGAYWSSLYSLLGFNTPLLVVAKRKPRTSGAA